MGSGMGGGQGQYSSVPPLMTGGGGGGRGGRQNNRGKLHSNRFLQ